MQFFGEVGGGVGELSLGMVSKNLLDCTHYFCQDKYTKAEVLVLILWRLMFVSQSVYITLLGSKSGWVMEAYDNCKDEECVSGKWTAYHSLQRSVKIHLTQ